MSVHVVSLSIRHLQTVTSWIDSTINYLLNLSPTTTTIPTTIPTTILHSMILIPLAVGDSPPYKKDFNKNSGM
ncbi:hypothetical protein N665_0229s0061 [Sinapis alba]|nr:hypothetical protein N665_0229s0061 [Sinapis alba]